MNPTLSLTLSFFLFAFISNLSTNNAVRQILDTNGKPVVSSKQYFIFSVDNPKKGGLTLNKVSDVDSKCPLTVIQDDDITGLSVKFTNLESATNNILEETGLDIEFTEKPECAESSKWLFVDDSIHQRWLGIGGPANYRGVKTIGGKFSILKNGFDDSYMIAFCSPITGDCDSLGLLEFNYGEGGSRLILTDDAYAVVFVDTASVKYESMVSAEE